MNNGEPSDKELINGFLQGDQRKFEQLYERYRKPLYSYLNQMIPGQTATVDDMFQKTWIKAIDNLDRYQDRQTFFAWIVRIARNTSIDHFRKSARVPQAELEENALPSVREIPWRRINNEELAAAIHDAVDDLPPDQQEVFNLRQERIPFKEIAEIQGCSLNTVLGRMHYAVNRLRKVLQEWK